MEDPFTINVPSGFVLTYESKKTDKFICFHQSSFDTFKILQYNYTNLYLKCHKVSDDIVFECTDKTVDLTPYKPWLEANNIKIKE